MHLKTAGELLAYAQLSTRELDAVREHVDIARSKLSFLADFLENRPIWAVRAEVGKLKAEIKLDLLEMEKRLNERIDTRLVHR